MAHQANEILRKSLHIGFGLFAFSLTILTWWQAAIVALIAVLHNWLVLHRVWGKRVARDARGFDTGIILYPVVVFLLVVIFRNRLEIAGLAWAILAFGDGFATLAGKLIRGPKLPWNRDKSWSGFVAFLLFGIAGGQAVFSALQREPSFVPGWLIVTLACLVAGFAESLPLEVDDNLTVPLTASLTALAATSAVTLPDLDLSGTALAWLAVNAILATIGYFVGMVNRSGFVGGWVIGVVIIVFGGWPLYVALLAFFILGAGTTKLGYRRKAAEGLAQEEGGRRGFRHAVANTGVAAILALLLAMCESWNLLLFAAIASLATAAADTVGSEIGQLFGRRAFLPISFRSVPRGTEGAVSIEGTLASFAAAFAVATVGVLAAYYSKIAYPSLHGITFGNLIGPIAVIGSAGFIAAYIESIVGAWNRNRARCVPNDALNFFNTLVGALLVIAYALVQR